LKRGLLLARNKYALHRVEDYKPVGAPLRDDRQFSATFLDYAA
jgi:hypothetical protein